MLRVFAALRALAWSTGFILLWGWLALQIRGPAGGTLPAVTRPVGTVCMVLGGALALWCISLFVVVGRGTPAPFDPPQMPARNDVRAARRPPSASTALLAWS